jgi:peptidoglycan/xylan/chitin deacetylase (PgdA/CDA1 family)
MHAAAAAGTIVMPAVWPWALGAVAANHALLTAAGLWPRSTLLGPNLLRLPASAAARGEIALTIDDGPDPEVTPRVLDLLDEAGVRATFFCIGQQARAYPVLCRDIAARGHRVENHGDTHSSAFSLFGPKRMRCDIAAAQTTLSELSGAAPRFFRATAGLRNPFLDPVLHGLNLQLATWTHRAFDTRCADPDTVFARLTRSLVPGDILLLHDGHAARSASGEPIILAVLPRLLKHFGERNLRCVTLAEALPS